MGFCAGLRRQRRSVKPLFWSGEATPVASFKFVFKLCITGLSKRDEYFKKVYMKPPDVITTIRDPKSGMTYHVKAYRKLSREELILAIRHYHASKKPKKRNIKTVTIKTIIGYNE